jgi:riboflavin kinase
VIHEFPEDFYGVSIRVLVLGFIRPEQNYCSLGRLNRIGRMNTGDRLLTLVSFVAELIRDIKTDVQVAKHSLKRPAYDQLQRDKMFE